MPADSVAGKTNVLFHCNFSKRNKFLVKMSIYIIYSIDNFNCIKRNPRGQSTAATLLPSLGAKLMPL